MKKKNPVINFQMASEDSQRMSEFYSSVFGWETQALGPEMGNYVFVKTTESDDKGVPLLPGAVNGGFYPKTAEGQQQFTNIIISVDDIHASVQKAKEAGAIIHGDPMLIPGVGQFVSFFDTEGNRVAMLQPIEE